MSQAYVEKRDFEGVIIRRDPDGFGIVEFKKPSDIGVTGVFTGEVLQNPEIARKCVVGTRVVGRAGRKFEGFKILQLEPATH